MIYLETNKSNTVIVTLFEKAITVNPYYLWEITDYDTEQKYYFCGDDFSSAPYNYNQFSFSVVSGATMGLTQGIIPAPTGKYIYNVYEMTYNYDLNISNAINKVEIGLLNITGTQTTINTYTASDDSVIITYKN